MNKKVILKINGIEIPLNPFVKSIFINVISGLVESLDKIPDDKTKTEITIENVNK